MALSAGASLAANGAEFQGMQLAQGTAVTPSGPAVGAEQPVPAVEKAKPKKTKAHKKHKKHKKPAAPKEPAAPPQ